MKMKLFSLFALLAAFSLTACNGNSTNNASNGGNGGNSVPAQAAEHNMEEDEWTEGTKTGLFVKETCSCGLVGYRCNVAEADGWNDDTVKMNGKTAPNNKSTWAATGLPAGKYDVWFNCKMSYDSHSNRYWYNQWENDSAQTPDKESEDPFRYWVEIDSTVCNPTNTESWGESGLSGSEFKDCVVIQGVTVPSNAGTINLVHGNIGYSLAIAYLRFVVAK